MCLSYLTFICSSIIPCVHMQFWCFQWETAISIVTRVKEKTLSSYCVQTLDCRRIFQRCDGVQQCWRASCWWVYIQTAMHSLNSPVIHTGSIVNIIGSLGVWDSLSVHTSDRHTNRYEIYIVTYGHSRSLPQIYDLKPDERWRRVSCSCIM